MPKLVPSDRIRATHVTLRSAPLGVAIGSLRMVADPEWGNDIQKLRDLLFVEIARLNAAMEEGEYWVEEEDRAEPVPCPYCKGEPVWQHPVTGHMMTCPYCDGTGLEAGAQR